MQEYTIQRSARRCHKANRPFEPNERYYSVVLQKGSELVRLDLSKEHWNGPLEGTVGWWASQMPAKPTGKLALAPTQVLLDALERLCEQPEDCELAYLLSLLLIRRRILTEQDDNVPSDEDTYLHLHHGQHGRTFTVQICHPDSESAAHLQQKLIELLYSES
ncbi:MAG: hypothetical protein K9M08_04810 [Pirellula sp.]|nr:hypothetical protein [Pirellula sp.]